MRKFAFPLIAAFAAVASVPASASTVVTTACVSVTDSAGCLFNGNINGNPDPTNVNSFKNAEAAYNAVRNPDISLSFISKSDDANFSSFGSITGAGTSSGTWSLPGWVVNFVAVKAGSQFVLYQIAPASSGNWNTLNIPFNNNPREVSHLAFFGTLAVPEPSTWAMMIGGFGLLGAAARRRKERSVLA